MKRLVLTSIRFYQKYISKQSKIKTCRYLPTCSEYTYEAVEHYGIIKGSFLGFKRILRCNPLLPGGYDPVK